MRALRVSLGLTFIVGAIGCGSSKPAGTAGAAGSGATAGASGAAGAAGSSAAATSGAAGKTGAAGAAGSGETAGAGGAGAGGAGAGGARDAAAPPADAGAPEAGTLLASKYPGDQGIEADPAVIFHSDFESGFAGWSSHTQDTTLIDVDTDATTAHGGTKYLRASVSRTALAKNPYISANAQFNFPRRVPLAYWRFYARFVGASATPHHWVRLGAGTPAYQSDGLANTVPPGDQGFWFDLDAHDDGLLSFYVYWYKMRSGRCNDGTAIPGCAGDQGTTYYYGNNFSPAGQTPFPRDKWFCIEIMTKANTVGSSDGELALWVDDALVGDYKPGAPHGRWLRDNFYTWGPYYQDMGPFEGFDFRSSADVLVKRITLDAYYEMGSLDARIAAGLAAPETQTVLYDDVVVATSRIGCK
jgi:hypothetical protein